ncbi:zonadhesin [Ditylenchus destructor]|nr:zonadhesin [Ditylenchus destructor]
MFLLKGIIALTLFVTITAALLAKAGQRCPANEKYVKKPQCPDISCDMLCKVLPRSGDSPCEHGNITLQSGCFCVPNFARNKTGICIPVEQCKCTLAGTRSCPANEVYVENPTCPEWTCKMSNNVSSRPGNPPPCVHGNVTGPSGCYCVTNYARTKVGICIPFKQCKHQEM